MIQKLNLVIIVQNVGTIKIALVESMRTRSSMTGAAIGSQKECLMTTYDSDIHVAVSAEQLEKLKRHYPERGEISQLVRRIFDFIIIQLDETITVNVENTAAAAVADERGRGLRNGAKPK